MQLHEKIHLMRTIKCLSQEDMAEKLGISPNGYGKIERGETDVQWSRLEQIAEIFGITITELLNLSETTFFNLNLGRDQNNNIASEYIESNLEMKHELEKVSLLLEQKDKEIALLREQILQLKEIIELIKK
jgi:transcriptional regulator with XRE-family HTH domain